MLLTKQEILRYGLIERKKEIEIKMTNAEKFEEVFGIKIDEDYPAGICQTISHDICEQNICTEECPAFKFWDREYKEPVKSFYKVRKNDEEY